MTQAGAGANENNQIDAEPGALTFTDHFIFLTYAPLAFCGFAFIFSDHADALPQLLKWVSMFVGPIGSALWALPVAVSLAVKAERTGVRVGATIIAIVNVACVAFWVYKWQAEITLFQ